MKHNNENKINGYKMIKIFTGNKNRMHAIPRCCVTSNANEENTWKLSDRQVRIVIG